VWQGLQDIRSEKDQFTEEARYFYYRLLLEGEQEKSSEGGDRKALQVLNRIQTHMRAVDAKLSVEALPYREVFSDSSHWLKRWNIERAYSEMSVLDEKVFLQQQTLMQRGKEIENDRKEQIFLFRHKDKIEELKSNYRGARGAVSAPLHRESSSESYFKPSTGRAGNIIGSRFPQKLWVLTYDDGPAATTTGEIMGLLEAKQVPAVFFWLRRNTKLYPNLVSRAIDMHRTLGVELANHSYTHYNLAKASKERLHYEVTQSSEEHIQQFYDLGFPRREPALTFFRLPYGSVVNTRSVRQKIVDNDLIHVFWNVDSLDWQDKRPSSVVARVKKQMQQRGGGVILFHDIHASTVDASRLLFADEIFYDMQWLNLSQMMAKVPAESDSGPGFHPDYDKDYYVYVDGSLNVREKSISSKVCGSLSKNQRVRLVDGSQAQGSKALIAVDKVLSPDRLALRNCQEPVVSAHYLRLYPKP
jgi:peptidoglycan/xylan/chitin deacetylase (PgdA/CDA1 family)